MATAACSAQPVGAPTPTVPEQEPTPTPTSPSPTTPFIPAADCEDATLEGAVVTIRLEDNVFLPECLTVLGGQSLRIRNRGSNVHNLSVEGTDVDLDIQPGSQTSTEPIGGIVPPGTHIFYCAFHRATGMEGEITITAAG
jgi:plastocyanin